MTTDPSNPGSFFKVVAYDGLVGIVLDEGTAHGLACAWQLAHDEERVADPSPSYADQVQQIKAAAVIAAEQARTGRMERSAVPALRVLTHLPGAES